MGNIIDRLHDEAVTDFFNLYIGQYHWPVFNGADIFITTGVLCLLRHNLGGNQGLPCNSGIDRRARPHNPTIAER